VAVNMPAGGTHKIIHQDPYDVRSWLRCLGGGSCRCKYY
jgi:hypothetical protein